MGFIVGKSTRKRPSPVEIESTHISVDKQLIFYIGGLTFLLTPQHVHGVASCKSKAIHAQRPNYGTDVSLQVERFFDVPVMRQ